MLESSRPTQQVTRRYVKLLTVTVWYRDQADCREFRSCYLPEIDPPGERFPGALIDAAPRATRRTRLLSCVVVESTGAD